MMAVVIWIQEAARDFWPWISGVPDGAKLVFNHYVPKIFATCKVANVG